MAPNVPSVLCCWIVSGWLGWSRRPARTRSKRLPSWRWAAKTSLAVVRKPGSRPWRAISVAWPAAALDAVFAGKRPWRAAGVPTDPPRACKSLWRRPRGRSCASASQTQSMRCPTSTGARSVPCTSTGALARTWRARKTLPHRRCATDWHAGSRCCDSVSPPMIRAPVRSCGSWRDRRHRVRRRPTTPPPP